MIIHGISELNKRNAKPMKDGYWHGFMHPTSEYQLINSAGFKGWMKYTQADSVVRNYNIGIIAGVKFFISSETQNFALSGDTLATGSGSLHGTVIVGRGAYGVTEIPASGQSNGFRMYIKKSGDQTTGDPVNQKMTVGWKTTMAVKVLNKSAGVILISTSIV